MINHLTECKTDKTVINNIEWTNGRSSQFEKIYKIGDRALHKTRKEA
jgi:hypothetical protein